MYTEIVTAAKVAITASKHNKYHVWCVHVLLVVCSPNGAIIITSYMNIGYILSKR